MVKRKIEIFTNGREKLVMASGECGPEKHYIMPPWTTGKKCRCGQRKLKSMIVEGGQVVAFEASVVAPSRSPGYNRQRGKR